MVSVLIILTVLSTQLCLLDGFRTVSLPAVAKASSFSGAKFLQGKTSTGLHCREEKEVYNVAPVVLLDGFFNATVGLSDLRVLQSVHAQSRGSRIVVVTDSAEFARKRLVTPSTVYSGLLDNVQYEEVDNRCGDRYKQLVGNAEVLISYGLTPTELQSVVTSVCTSENLKRVVLAVETPGGGAGDLQGGDSAEINQALSMLRSQSRSNYTVFKYAAVEARKEGLRPYRVVRNGLPLPVGVSSLTPERLSSGDLFRVLAEVVNLPKTYQQVYGIGPGTALDAEIATYMKSRGWSERVQVGLLVGDMMEVIEQRVEEENKRAKQQPASARTARPSNAGDREVGLNPAVRQGYQNKFAGFFT